VVYASGPSAAPTAIEASLPLDETGSISSLNDGDIARSWFVDVRADSDVMRAGGVELKVKASADGRRKLKHRGKFKASAQITFTPTGGSAATQNTRVKLLRD
jgi:hypothetical protein